MKSKLIDQRRQPGYFPYYKVQWYNVCNLAWEDIQRRFTSREAAQATATSLVPFGTQFRLMEVTRTDRHPLTD
ncbi:MAG TPA: hypothetical protein VJA25_02500 [Dehalococcoidia bacterium]|nr:hypothetical protein [Dehalococcoidia bacterium]